KNYDLFDYAAFTRIQIFLADLNLVLGLHLLPCGDIGELPPSPNHVSFSKHAHRHEVHQLPLRNHPTLRAKAWKKKLYIETCATL
ncbi:hypothetical protein VP01_4832g2, partial [Puccinia sorghi]